MPLLVRPGLGALECEGWEAGPGGVYVWYASGRQHLWRQPAALSTCGDSLLLPAATAHRLCMSVPARSHKIVLQVGAQLGPPPPRPVLGSSPGELPYCALGQCRPLLDTWPRRQPNPLPACLPCMTPNSGMAIS